MGQEWVSPFCSLCLLHFTNPQEQDQQQRKKSSSRKKSEHDSRAQILLQLVKRLLQLSQLLLPRLANNASRHEHSVILLLSLPYSTTYVHQLVRQSMEVLIE